MGQLDPRLYPYRPDLAAARLEGRVEATRYVAGTCRQVRNGVAALRRAPAAGAELVSQLLGGEVVTVYDEADGWAWVQNQTDGYVGYTPAAALSAELRKKGWTVRERGQRVSRRRAVEPTPTSPPTSHDAVLH